LTDDVSERLGSVTAVKRQVRHGRVGLLAGRSSWPGAATE